MKITNVRIYGLEESIIASGYPMQTEIVDFSNMSDEYVSVLLNEKDNKRAKHLGSAKPGSGHDCYLKGIIVQADIKAPEYFWRQMDRYHFRDYVSSQSKMHRILKMDLDEVCNKYVDMRVKAVLRELICEYNNSPTTKNFQRVVSNVPCGLELTARITTNYLQLKSIYNQRKNHKLEEWREIFCPWILSLPRFEELTGVR